MGCSIIGIFFICLHFFAADFERKNNKYQRNIWTYQEKSLSLPKEKRSPINGNTITQRLMTQLVITLKDSSYVSNIRRIVKSLVGVEKVSAVRQNEARTTTKKLSRYEKSLLDAEEGRVNEYANSEELFKKMGI